MVTKQAPQLTELLLDMEDAPKIDEGEFIKSIFATMNNLKNVSGKLEYPDDALQSNLECLTINTPQLKIDQISRLLFIIFSTIKFDLKVLKVHYRNYYNMDEIYNNRDIQQPENGRQFLRAQLSRIPVFKSHDGLLKLSS